MSKIKGKILHIPPKTLWRIYMDFIPQCKLFIRFLKEEGSFKEFFRTIHEQGIPEWINHDCGKAHISESTIMRDIMFRTINIEDPKFEQTDKRWLKKISKYIEYGEYDINGIDDEINRFITIAEKYGIKIN